MAGFIAQLGQRKSCPGQKNFLPSSTKVRSIWPSKSGDGVFRCSAKRSGESNFEASSSSADGADDEVFFDAWSADRAESAAALARWANFTALVLDRALRLMKVACFIHELASLRARSLACAACNRLT